MTTHRKQAAGGGTTLEIPRERLVGWVERFSRRHGPAAGEVSLGAVTLTAPDGATARMAPPFAPMDPQGTEPLEAIFRHIDGIGDVAVVLVRARAFSVGIARDGLVVSSSTDTRYVQGRTKAGGWSQQRYARRRGNQRSSAYHAAIEATCRMLDAHQGSVDCLVMGGDKVAIQAVLNDSRLATVASLPRRTFPDIVEPRRAVLDDIAQRCLTVEITVRESGSTSRT